MRHKKNQRSSNTKLATAGVTPTGGNHDRPHTLTLAPTLSSSLQMLSDSSYPLGHAHSGDISAHNVRSSAYSGDGSAHNLRSAAHSVGCVLLQPTDGIVPPNYATLPVPGGGYSSTGGYILPDSAPWGEDPTTQHLGHGPPYTDRQ